MTSALNSNVLELNSQVEPLESPFDITQAPANFLVGPQDAPDQEAALASAYRAPDKIQDNGEEFSRERLVKLPLRRLETWCEEGDTLSAIGALRGRKWISYDENNYTVKADDGNIFWTMNKTYLDLLICVGGGLGLGPLLPNARVLHTYEFKMDLQKPARRFTAKYVKLGFDPTGVMLWIGRSSASEDVWLAFPPRSFIEGEEYDEDGGMHWRGQRATALSRDIYRRVVMFLAVMLCNINYLDITVANPYPNLADEKAFEEATNVL
jgi:hypothetical protein